MVSKAKKRKSIIITTSLILLILIIGFLAVSQSIVGVSNDLEYSNEWDNQDLKTGNYQSEAILKIPEGTTLFSFTPEYSLDSYYKSSADPRVKTQYEVFNFKTNSYELIHNSDITINNNNRDGSDFDIDGTQIYLTGRPEAIDNIWTQYSSSRENRRAINYISCLEGMSLNEAKELYCEGSTSSYCGGDSRKSIQCIYPGEKLVEHDVQADSDEDWDIELFPKLITLDTDYIKENTVKFKISVNVISGGLDRLDADDFEIDLWKVETPVVDTYSFDGITCNYQAKYTYQTLENDYFTENECKLQNKLFECYLSSHCADADEGEKANCKENSCEYTKETIWDKIFPDRDEPTEEEQEDEEGLNILSLIFPIVILTLVVLIIRNLIKRRKK